jgi:hypothetical protein
MTADADRQAIYGCVLRYARGVDRLDRSLVESAFFLDAIIDQGMFVGRPAEFADWAIAMHWRVHLAHQHIIANHLSQVIDGAGSAETYFLFIGVNRDGAKPISASGGRYIDTFERRDGQWRIAGRVTLRDWSTEAASGTGQSALASVLDAAALALLQHGPEGTRDPTDPSYDPETAIRHAADRYSRLQ